MKISTLLKNELISLGLPPMTKEQAIKELVSLNESAGTLFDAEKFLDAVLKREKEVSTDMGFGIAVPHAKSSAVKIPSLSAITTLGEELNLVFMIAVPKSNSNLHLEILSSLSGMLLDEGFRLSLRRAKTKEEFIWLIKEKEMPLTKTVKITNPLGLHMRPATAFANAMKKYSSSISIISGSKIINGKSPINIMAAGLESGSSITLECIGADREEMLAEAEHIIEIGFGEI